MMKASRLARQPFIRASSRGTPGSRLCENSKTGNHARISAGEGKFRLAPLFLTEFIRIGRMAMRVNAFGTLTRSAVD